MKPLEQNRHLVAAPTAGVVALAPPRELAGELELFDGGEVVATIDAVPVACPVDGFVLRYLVADGATVREGDPVVLIRAI